MKPIDWYQGKKHAAEYKKLFATTDWVSEFPKKPEPTYFVIDTTGLCKTSSYNWEQLMLVGYKASIMVDIKVKEMVWIDDNLMLVKRILPEDVKHYECLKKMYQTQRSALESEFKKDLCEEYLRYPQLSDICFKIAWERGHSSGLHEVLNVYDDVADQLEQAFELGIQYRTEKEKVKEGSVK